MLTFDVGLGRSCVSCGGKCCTSSSEHFLEAFHSHRKDIELALESPGVGEQCSLTQYK